MDQKYGIANILDRIFRALIVLKITHNQITDPRRGAHPRMFNGFS